MAAVLAAGALTLAACGGSSSAGTGDSSVDPSAVVSASGEVEVGGAWIRPTPPISNIGAFYLTIRNDGASPDRLVGATAPRCAEIEIHQTETDEDDVASMGEATADQLTIEAGRSLVFEPSGLHVMCLGLDEPVEAGQLVTLTVELERAGPVTVEAVAENR